MLSKNHLRAGGKNLETKKVSGKSGDRKTDYGKTVDGKTDYGKAVNGKPVINSADIGIYRHRWHEQNIIYN